MQASSVSMTRGARRRAGSRLGLGSRGRCCASRLTSVLVIDVGITTPLWLLLRDLMPVVIGVVTYWVVVVLVVADALPLPLVACRCPSTTSRLWDPLDIVLLIFGYNIIRINSSRAGMKLTGRGLRSTLIVLTTCFKMRLVELG
jgi:hypothetical protein